jgi:hypothetical protein
MSTPQFLIEQFLMEIKHQCEFAEMAYEDLLRYAYSPTVGTQRVIYSLQAFLIAAANISKLLWPDKKYSMRGSELVDMLSIDETHSVLKSRAPRNHFEHFDERLHEWYNTSTHHNVIDLSVGPADRMVSGQIDFMRFFNTTTFAFKFRNDEYQIEPMMDEIKEILWRVEKRLDVQRASWGSTLNM